MVFGGGYAILPVDVPKEDCYRLVVFKLFGMDDSRVGKVADIRSLERRYWGLMFLIVEERMLHNSYVPSISKAMI